MKEFYKFALSVLCVIGVILFIDIVAGTVFDKHAYFIDNTKYGRIEDADEEVVILGASRAHNHYVSNTIAAELHKSAYNYGVGAMNVYVNYGVLNLLVNKSKNKPEYVIWDFYTIDIMNIPGWNKEKLDELNTAYNYDDTIKEIVGLQGKDKTFLIKMSKLYKYNSRLQGGMWKVLKTGSYHRLQNDRGYTPMSIVHNDSIKTSTDNRTDIDQSKMQYIDRLISLCKKNDIKLFVFISPSYYKIANITQDDWSVVMEETCRKHHIPFFNYEQDTTFLSHPEWFYNPLHLNDVGARKYTELVVRDIKTFEINDSINNLGYERH